MSNLHRKLLGSNNDLLNPNKTISRKAASRNSSAASSRAGSRATSRANSRQVSRANSEDEFDDSDDAATVLSRDTQLDDLLEIPGGAEGGKSWEELLQDRITEILDRKRSSAEGREMAYTVYVRTLLANYAQDELIGRTGELGEAFLKSIRGGRTEKEALLATRALALTIITDPTEALWDKIARTLKTTLTDHESISLKKLIIFTLSIGCFFIGSEAEALSLMSFFLDIITSDGESVGAGQSYEVVHAALQGWGLLCTSLTSTDPQTITDDAIDALVDQLDSGHVEVQVAAGENIALLYEMSFTEIDEDMEEAQIEYWRARGKVLEYDDEVLIQKYQPYGRENDLLNTISGLTTGTKRHLNKKNRREQHNAFHYILRGVEHPLVGDGRPNQKLTVERGSQLLVDKWWKLVRVHGLKSMLKGGWQTHLIHNDTFFRRLGLTADSSVSYNVTRGKPRGKKPRWNSRFEGGSDDGNDY